MSKYKPLSKTISSKKPRFKKTKSGGLQDINKNINFKREGEKSNARKWPTEVVCITCEKKFVLPFKPRNPEVYCDECFKKPKSFAKHKQKKDKKHYFMPKK